MVKGSLRTRINIAGLMLVMLNLLLAVVCTSFYSKLQHCVVMFCCGCCVHVHVVCCDYVAMEEGLHKLWQGVTPAIYRHIGTLREFCCNQQAAF